MAMAEKVKWHEWSWVKDAPPDDLGIVDSYFKCSCGKKKLELGCKGSGKVWNVGKCINPRYSISPHEGYISLVELLKLWGEYEAFVEWNNVNCWNTPSGISGCSVSAEILQSPDLLMQSIMSFKERE
jgi:hypothetical protein